MNDPDNTEVTLETTITEVMELLRTAQASIIPKTAPSPDTLRALDKKLRGLVGNTVHLPHGLNPRGRYTQSLERLVEQLIEAVRVHTDLTVVMTRVDDDVPARRRPAAPHEGGRRVALKLRLFDLFDQTYENLLLKIAPPLKDALRHIPELQELAKNQLAENGDGRPVSPLSTMLALGLYTKREDYAVEASLSPPRVRFERLIASEIEKQVDELWADITTRIEGALEPHFEQPQRGASAAQIMGDPRMSDQRGVLAGSLFALLHEYAGARMSLARQKWASLLYTKESWEENYYDVMTRDIRALTGDPEARCYSDAAVEDLDLVTDGLVRCSKSYLRRVVGLSEHEASAIVEARVYSIRELRKRAPKGIEINTIVRRLRAHATSLSAKRASKERTSKRRARHGPANLRDRGGDTYGERVAIIKDLDLGELHKRAVTMAKENPRVFCAVLERVLSERSNRSDIEREKIDGSDDDKSDHALAAPLTAAELEEIEWKAVRVVDQAPDVPGTIGAWAKQWWIAEKKLCDEINAEVARVRNKRPFTALEDLLQPGVPKESSLGLDPERDRVSPRRERPPNPQQGPATSVLVVGAGITGLTAAHELAERGFKVYIVEKLESPGPDGEPEAVLGGLAASQWSRPAQGDAKPGDKDDANDNCRDDDNPRGRTQNIRTSSWSARRTVARDLNDSLATIYFKEDEDQFADPLAAVEKLISLGRKYGNGAFELTISGHTDGLEARTEKNVKLGLKRARMVRDLLNLLAIYGRKNTGDPLQLKFATRDLGATRPMKPDQSHPGNRRVEIRQAEDILPGEHGYRFFPSFYRHLFDTMRRTPIYDRDGNETERTVFDNLTPTYIQGFSGTYQDVNLARDKARSIEGFRRDLRRMLVDLGFERTDITRFSTRMLRYMLSSKDRRADYEHNSWWDFVTLQRLQPNAPKDAPRMRYSDEFSAHLKAAPQALVAMDAETCDARTQGSIVVQLMLDQILDRGGPTDCTLNGPTSTAWFIPWRRHLEQLGVTFLPPAELLAMDVDVDSPGGLRLTFEPQIQEGALAADYVVMATDVLTAEAVTKQLRLGAESVPSRLRGYTSVVLEPAVEGAPAPGHERPLANVTDETSQLEFEWPIFGLSPADRLQVFSGVQFYFRNDLELTRGHVYYHDTEWGLSSISQSQFWKQKRSLRDRGVLGVLSVDIGNFLKPSRYLDRPASQCSEEVIAQESWRQMSESLRRARDRRRLPDSTVLPIPEPRYYHVDDHLLFSRYRDACTTLTPFLVNIVGDWKNRPGAEPWDPTFPRERVERRTEPNIWQAGHGGYQVHFDRLVFAGTYVRTFTRMTTMEAANESARHAVNAIMDHMTARREVVVRGAYQRAIKHASDDGKKSAPDHTALEALLDRIKQIDEQPRIAGDYCKIFDPEQHELEQLDFLKRVDAMLVKEDLPHMFDILGVEALLDHLQPDEDPLDGLLAAFSDTMKDDWTVKTSEVLGALGPLKRFGNTLRQQMGNDASANLGDAMRKLAGWVEKLKKRS